MTRWIARVLTLDVAATTLGVVKPGLIAFTREGAAPAEPGPITIRS